MINGTEQNLEIKPTQLIINKGSKNIQMKKTVSSAGGVGKVRQPHVNH